VSDTIFMIHGMWGGPWTWENCKAFFGAQGYHCVTTTLRFHGCRPSDPPDRRLGTTSLLDYVEDLEREIRSLDVKPIVMGHSMGGLLAQILGSRGLAKALVLLAPAPPSGISAALRLSVLRSFSSLFVNWGFWNKPIRQSFRSAVYSMLHLLPSEQQEEVYRRLVHESGRAVFEIGLWFLDSRRASEVDASRVHCPVLFVAGAHDRIVPASTVRKAAGKYGTNATYKELENNGHWLLSEPGWLEIAEYVAEWLQTPDAMAPQTLCGDQEEHRGGGICRA